MATLLKIIEEPLKLLGEYSVECVIMGGVAATLHGSTILTNDLWLSELPAVLKI